MSRIHRYVWSSRLLVTLVVLLLFSLTGGTVATATTPTIQEANGSASSEEPYIEAAPEPGDEYFEAEASDGRWISYINPRDEYRDPYLGDGSGKICAVLLNEAGDPIVGETVPNTTVTVPTGETLDWHSSADPMTVEYPLTENYDRPLDSDQFGTADDVPQGDGYMDSHCIEFHGPAIGDEIEYGEATVDGAHADRIELVGYIQKTGTWETDIDPLEAATSYEEAGGGWTFRESESHGQVVVVLQLAGDYSNSTEQNGTDPNGTASENQRDVDNGTEDRNEIDNESTEEIPGFGIVGTVVGILLLVVVALVRRP
jgi:PGF-CTERM protein